MSDTPKTDANCGWPVGHHGRIECSDLRWSPDGPFVHSSVARELERENAALLDLVEDMAHQHCRTCIQDRDYNDQLAGTRVTDSGALSASANALRFLAAAQPPRFRVVAEFGRMVVGYLPENDPQKQPSSTPSDP